jgi:hypothetical protein
LASQGRNEMGNCCFAALLLCCFQIAERKGKARKFIFLVSFSEAMLGYPSAVSSAALQHIFNTTK